MQNFSTKSTLCKSKLLLLMFSFAFSYQGGSQTFTVDNLMLNGSRNNRVNFVYLSDGYLTSQLPTFITNANTINNATFNQTPFKEYKNYFNAFAIRVPSEQAGAKHPGNASDEGSLVAHPVANPNNYFNSTFDFNLRHRALVATNNTAIENVLASNLPDYSIAMIIVNSPFYGGTGGRFATVSTDANSGEIAIHEFGHSFAGLADEYWAGDVFARERPNMTANSNSITVKWKNWVGINNVGVYAHGSSGNPGNWYKPHQTCKMNLLNNPFCSVCTERFIDVIHSNVDMIDAHNPEATSISLNNTDPVDFSVTAVQTNPAIVKANWYLNESTTPFAIDKFSVSVPYESFTEGNNLVKAELIDNTSLSKSYRPGVGYINSVTWTVNHVILPIQILNFSGSLKNKTAILNWEIDSPDDLQAFELQKSKDGENFSKLSTIASENAKKNYTFADDQIFANYTYYRLKIIEKNGTEFFSNTTRLQNAFDKYYYKVYQHAESKQFHLSVGITKPERVSFNIIDAQGKMILKKNFGNVEKQIEYDFNLNGKPSGIYFMTIFIDKNKYSVNLMVP